MMDKLAKFIDSLPSPWAEPVPYGLAVVGLFLIVSALVDWRRITQPDIPRRDAVRRLIYLKGGRWGYRLYLIGWGIASIILAYVMLAV